MPDNLCIKIPWEQGDIHYKEFQATVNDTHYKFDELCIVRVLKGSAVWMIGHEQVRAEAGDIIFLNNLEIRKRTVVSSDLSIAAFSFPVPFLSVAVECLQCFYARGVAFSHRLRDGQLLACYDAIAEEMREGRSTTVILAHTLLLLTRATRLYAGTPQALLTATRHTLSGAAAISASLQRINQGLTAELYVDELAREAGMSVGHYTRLFHQLVMQTPAHYIAERRVALFLSRLQAGEDNVLETAFSCGFTSASGFYKTFARVCGCSPMQKLKEMRRKGCENNCDEDGAM